MSTIVCVCVSHSDKHTIEVCVRAAANQTPTRLLLLLRPPLLITAHYGLTTQAHNSVANLCAHIDVPVHVYVRTYVRMGDKSLSLLL